MKEFIKMYKEIKDSKGFRYSDWYNTGLLSNLSSEQEPQVVELFEKGMQYVLKNDIDDKRNQLILPIIRRVYASLVTHKWVNDKNKLLLYNIIDIDDLIKDFYLLYENTMSNFLLNFKYIDIELEFCSLFSNNYIGRLSKEFFKNKTEEEILLILTRDDKLKKLIK